MNRGEIKSAVRLLGYGGDLDAALNAAINDVNRRVHGKRRWPWMEATSTGIALPLGSSSVSPASEILHIDAVRLEHENLDLEYREPQELLRLLHVDPSRGVPELWTRHGGLIRVYPRAQSAYTVVIHSVGQAPPLTDDAAVPPPPETYHDIYTYGSAQLLAARERDWPASGFYQQQYVQRLLEMEQEVGIRQRQTAQQVERPTWYRNF